MGRNYVIISIISILAAALIGAGYYVYERYEKTDASDVPVVPVHVDEFELKPIAGDISVPVMDGLFEKPLDCIYTDNGWWVIPPGAAVEMQDPATSLGIIGEAPFSLNIAMLDTMTWTVHVAKSGSPYGSEPLFSGESSIEEFLIAQTGEYEVWFEGKLEGDGRTTPSGTFFYRAYFSVVDPPPEFIEGRTNLEQGDILSLKLVNIPEDIIPEIETELGPAIFTRGSPSFEENRAENIKLSGLEDWYAIVPISNTREPGEYIVTVSAGEMVFETIVTVYEYDFDLQNMIIDTSVPSVAAATTNEAIVEFREKVSPLIPLITEERYWNGLFIMPVDLGETGFISTEFGEIRITNGNPNTRRTHNGMDLAVKTGTPIHATGAGKVLLAEFLLNTGNTVIIDHGGGLKSFYYHLDSIYTVVGRVVETGEFIGEVGTTGYSTGPHLHFEMRIGEQPVSPSMLFEPSAGLYSAY